MHSGRVSVHDHDLDDLSDPPQNDQDLDSGRPGTDDDDLSERPDDLQPASPALLIVVGATLLAVLFLVVAVIVWAVA